MAQPDTNHTHIIRHIVHVQRTHSDLCFTGIKTFSSHCEIIQVTNALKQMIQYTKTDRTQIQLKLESVTY